MVNITWKIPPGYKTLYFVVHVLDYIVMVEFQEVTEDNTTYHLIRNLRPYRDYAIFVQFYADGKTRGQSKPLWVRTLESSTFKTKTITRFNYI
jgi:hypothetical protein